MEQIETIPQLAPRSRTHRSRVSNGNKLLPLSDGRSVTARRFRDLYEDISSDLGGLAHLSEGQKRNYPLPFFRAQILRNYPQF